MKYLAHGSQLVGVSREQEFGPSPAGPRVHAYVPLLLCTCVCLASIAPVAAGGAWVAGQDVVIPRRLSSRAQTAEHT